MVLRQVSGMSHKVLGTTEFRIKVGQAAELLSQFLQNLRCSRYRPVHPANRLPTSSVIWKNW